MSDTPQRWNWTGEAIDAPMLIDEPRLIECPDMWTDGWTDEDRDKRCAVMALTPQHKYMVATERPEAMADYLHTLKRRMGGPACWFDHIPKKHRDMVSERQIPWPLPNVWLGATIHNQQTADERIRLVAPHGQLNDDRAGTHIQMARVGKKAAGRLLDGREWNEFPHVESGVA